MGVCETDGEAIIGWDLYVYECQKERESDWVTSADHAEPESLSKPANDTKAFPSGWVEARALNQLSDKPSPCFHIWTTCVHLVSEELNPLFDVPLSLCASPCAADLHLSNKNLSQTFG